MKVYFEQIPEGVSASDYPDGTVFVFDDSRPKRDPVTLELIPPEKRPLIYPEEVKKHLNHQP